MTHWATFGVAPKSRPIAGRAIATMVMSSAAMSTAMPRATTAGQTVGPFGYALAVVTYLHRDALQRRMHELGLYLGQELIVVDLHAHPASTQSELVARLGIEQPTVARALRRMAAAGFVEHRRDTADRRVRRLVRHRAGDGRRVRRRGRAGRPDLPRAARRGRGDRPARRGGGRRGAGRA